jgi:hypothetical protein
MFSIRTKGRGSAPRLLLRMLRRCPTLDAAASVLQRLGWPRRRLNCGDWHHTVGHLAHVDDSSAFDAVLCEATWQWVIVKCQFLAV